jgi:hypothetical protein
VKQISRFFIIALSLISISGFAQQKTTEQWESMFNGKDLSNWTVKIRNHPVGVNFGNTFRVEDKKIVVRYEAYDKFDERFGHLFYNKQYIVPPVFYIS